MTTAATVVLLRDGSASPEVLLLRRSDHSRTFPGAWVFPGGAVEPQDGSSDDESRVRRAAARELAEEAGLVVEPGDLVAWSTWTPPSASPARHRTAFFLAAAPEGVVSVDGNEIDAAQWWSPAAALEAHAAGDLSLLPPTWITLADLATAATSQQALASATGRRPSYSTEINRDGDRTILSWAERSEQLDISVLPWRLGRHISTDSRVEI